MNTTTRIRRTAVSLATAMAIALPGLASAAWGDRVQNRVQTVRTNAGIQITNVREQRPLAQAVERVKEPAAAIFEQVRELGVMEQFSQTMGLVNRMQADYAYFSGGEGCSATCASFRASLRNTFNDFISLVGDVPALSGNPNLIGNLQRIADLVDYIPPRALYLMWQAMSAQVTELEGMAREIRQTLDSLPPLLPPSSFGPNTVAVASNTSSTSGTGNSGLCAWSDQDKPVLDLIQARLEMVGWSLEKVADFIPDVSVKGEAGASAGAAVANGTASAGASVKPTDSLKIGMKVLALIPQQINWAIKINRLRAEVVCS